MSDLHPMERSCLRTLLDPLADGERVAADCAAVQSALCSGSLVRFFRAQSRREQAHHAFGLGCVARSVDAATLWAAGAECAVLARADRRQPTPAGQSWCRAECIPACLRVRPSRAAA